MRNGVHVAYVDLVDCHTRVVGGHCHRVAGVLVTTVTASRSQVIENQLDSDFRIFAATAPLPAPYIGLNSMCEGIHAGGGSNMWWQSRNKIRVKGCGKR